MKFRAKYLVIVLLLTMGITSLALFMLANSTHVQITEDSAGLPVPLPARPGQPLPVPMTAHPPEAMATMDTEPPEQSLPTAPSIPAPPTIVPAEWETLQALARSPGGESQEAREK